MNTNPDDDFKQTIRDFLNDSDPENLNITHSNRSQSLEELQHEKTIEHLPQP
jgi:hypothetical protein